MMIATISSPNIQIASANQTTILPPSLFLLRAFCVFSQASSLASDDRQEPYQRSRLTLLAFAVGHSLDKPLVSEPLPNGSIYETIKPRQGVVFNVAFVKAEGELINIAAKVLWACMVINAMQPALENSENALDAVCRYIFPNKLACLVIDRLMIKSEAKAFICASFIRVDCGTGFDLSNNFSLDCGLVSAGNRLSYGAASALTHPQDGSLTHRTTACVAPFGGVFVFFKATNIGFVDFNDALQLSQIFAACFAKAVKDKPCALLRDPDFLSKLHGRNTLARRHKEIHRVNPLVQRNVAALENRSGANREILFALVAAIVAVLAYRDALAKAANRATRPLRP